MRCSCRSASRIRRRSSARSRRSIAAGTPCWPRRWAPSATFSSTVMPGIIFTCWKVRGDAEAGDLARGERIDALAEQRAPSPRVAGSTPVTRLKVVDLPAPFGPIRPRISPARDLEADVVDRDQAAELLARVLHVEHHLAVRAAAAARAAPARRPSRPCAAARGRQRIDERPDAVARVLQHQHQQDAEDDDLVVAAGAHQLGQQHLELVLQDLHDAGADERAPDVADAAEHRHEQVLDAHVQAERRRVDGALEVREQPARDAGEQRREDERRDLDAEGVDAHRLGHGRAALDGAHRPAGARVEQVGHGDRRQDDDAPRAGRRSCARC